MNGKICILDNKKIQEQILQENYNLADVEQQRMFDLIKRNYWWPAIQNNIKKYIQGYQKC